MAKYKHPYLQITMDDPTFMQIADGINNRTNYLPCLVFSIDLLITDFLIEFPSREILEYEIDMFGLDIVIIELDNIGMIDILHDMYFPL